jgi:hypothetical protein
VYALNYPFVVGNPTSQSQIFLYLPEGLAHGLQVDVSQIVMHTLQPYDTTKVLGYITTLAMAYVPTNLVTQLQLGLHNPNDPLYINPDPSVQTIMSMINPSFPVTAGSSLGPGSAGDVPGGSNPSVPGGNGSPLGGDPAAQTSVKGTSIGIGVSIVAGAVLYGAAMFYVARRYKKRRQRHQRSPSMTDGHADQGILGPVMAGGAYMSGGRGTPGPANGTGSSSGGRESRGSGRSAGNSARTQQISAPLMAENSLGWN